MRWGSEDRRKIQTTWSIPQRSRWWMHLIQNPSRSYFLVYDRNNSADRSSSSISTRSFPHSWWEQSREKECQSKVAVAEEHCLWNSISDFLSKLTLRRKPALYSCWRRPIDYFINAHIFLARVRYLPSEYYIIRAKHSSMRINRYNDYEYGPVLLEAQPIKIVSVGRFTMDRQS